VEAGWKISQKHLIEFIVKKPNYFSINTAKLVGSARLLTKDPDNKDQKVRNGLVASKNIPLGTDKKHRAHRFW